MQIKENIKITVAKEIDEQPWDNYVLSHPKGIGYHFFAWKKAVENAYGLKGFYLIAKDNSKIVGLLPLIKIKLPFIGRTSLVSLPYCDAAGPLADSLDIERQLICHAKNLTGLLEAKTLTLRATEPMGGIPEKATKNLLKTRMVLKLPETPEILLSSFKAKLRSQIKKPVRDGLTIVSGGIDLLDDFFLVFAENMKDLGSPPHTRKWLKSVLSGYRNRSILFLVRMPDNTPVAGGILLLHPNMVSVPWASSLRRFNKWNPNMLLYWSFLKFACDFKYPYFDFGRSTPGEGTYKFKRQWGASPKYLHWIDCDVGNKTSGLARGSAQKQNISQKRIIAESILQKLPAPIFKEIGRVTRRYISL
nr:GNAT family N-acetyltransferase [uncultured Desulfobacter sp.]